MLVQVKTPPCPDCGKTERLVMPEKDYNNYIANEMSIQDALPTLSPAQRERLLTGLCGHCFEIMCKEIEGEGD